MSANEANVSTVDDKTPAVTPGNYSPVTVVMRDTVGAVFLGILAFMLLIGWTQAEARNRALTKQLKPA